MRSRTVCVWVLTALITLGSAFWQRLSGPTHAVHGPVELGGVKVRVRLERSWDAGSDQPIHLSVPDSAVGGVVAWRKYPSRMDWQIRPLVRRGDTLEASLPSQPAAGKLEFQVRLQRHGDEAVFPKRPAVTRFKAAVPP